jgi:hypothetical protein
MEAGENEACNAAIAAFCARFGSDCLVRHAGGFSEYLKQLGYAAATVEEKRDLLGISAAGLLADGNRPGPFRGLGCILMY